MAAGTRRYTTAAGTRRYPPVPAGRRYGWHTHTGIGVSVYHRYTRGRPPAASAWGLRGRSETGGEWDERVAVAQQSVREDVARPADGLEQPQRDHVGEHRRAALRHERQRQAGHWRDAHGHPDIDERLCSEPDRDTRGDQHPELIIGARRDPQRAGQRQTDESDPEQPPDETQLIA